MAGEHLVSIVVPCRNEAAFIDAFCADALRQALAPPWQLELIVADGHSDDGTRGVTSRSLPQAVITSGWRPQRAASVP